MSLAALCAVANRTRTLDPLTDRAIGAPSFALLSQGVHVQGQPAAGSKVSPAAGLKVQGP